MGHHRPGDSCDLVGKRDRCELRRAPLQQGGKPRAPLAVGLLGPPDHRQRADDQKPSQITVASLGDVPGPRLAAGRVLPGHQPDPGRQVAPRAKGMGIGDRSHQGGRNQRADTGDLGQATAHLARAMPGKDASVCVQDLLLDHDQLSAQGQQTVSRRRRHALIPVILNHLQELLQPVAADAGDNAVFGEMRS